MRELCCKVVYQSILFLRKYMCTHTEKKILKIVSKCQSYLSQDSGILVYWNHGHFISNLYNMNTQCLCNKSQARGGKKNQTSSWL